MGLTRAPILATVNYSSYPSAVLQLIQCCRVHVGVLQSSSYPSTVCRVCVGGCAISYSTHWISTGAAQIQTLVNPKPLTIFSDIHLCQIYSISFHCMHVLKYDQTQHINPKFKNRDHGTTNYQTPRIHNSCSSSVLRLWCQPLLCCCAHCAVQRTAKAVILTPRIRDSSSYSSVTKKTGQHTIQRLTHYLTVGQRVNTRIVC